MKTVKHDTSTHKSITKQALESSANENRAFQENTKNEDHRIGGKYEAWGKQN